MEDEKYNAPTPIDDLNLLHVRCIGAGPVRSFPPRPRAAVSSRDGVWQEHTVVVSTNSEIYSTGSSNYGKLGHKQAEMDEMDDCFEGACLHRCVHQSLDAACHNTLLHTTGALNSFREINILKEENRAAVSCVDWCSARSHDDTVVQKEKNICFVTCGPEYSIALADAGHVYCWGDGSDGKLGHQDNNNKKIPTKVRI